MATRPAFALLLLALLDACAAPRVIRLDTGQGSPLEYRPSSASQSVTVDAEAFEEALARLVLEVPLTLRASQRGLLVRASHPGNSADTRWQRLMRKSFGGLCVPGQRRDHCLSLLDIGPGLGEWDKLGIALGLSLEPLKESIARAVEKTLAPQLFYTVIATGLVTWAVLAANPTPGNVERFGPHALHNTENVIPLEEGLHTQVSAFYSRKILRITGSRVLTVRQWLSTQSYEAQRAFGLQTIENVMNGVW